MLVEDYYGHSQVVPVDLSEFCGQCHRSSEKVIRGPWRGELNVRFQLCRLANSKCFSGVDPRISCIATILTRIRLRTLLFTMSIVWPALNVGAELVANGLAAFVS